MAQGPKDLPLLGLFSPQYPIPEASAPVVLQKLAHTHTLPSFMPSVLHCT